MGKPLAGDLDFRQFRHIAIAFTPLNYHARMTTPPPAALCNHGFFTRLHQRVMHFNKSTLGGAALICTLLAGPWLPPTHAAQPVAEQASTSNAELVYLVLVGEMQIAAQQPGVGYSLILEAARKSGNSELYRRAVNVALESRSMDAAKEAVRVWTAAEPMSPEPHRVMLQLMLATAAISQSSGTLERLLTTVPEAERSAQIDLIGQIYAQASDRDGAHRVIANALKPWTKQPNTAASAWAAIGTVALAAGLKESAMAALTSALTSPQRSTGAAGLLAVNLLNAKESKAEALLTGYLDSSTDKSTAVVRMAYVRQLINENRTAEALKQLEVLVRVDPEAAEAWLVSGAINLQEKRLDLAEEQLKRYLTLSGKLDEERTQKSNAQAYLSLAQIAESKGQFDQAAEWLDRVENTDDVLRVQVRRAALLARRGKVEEARALIQQTPAQEAEDIRAKILAEAQLLKENSRLADAFTVLGQAVKQYPEDTELAYEQAMLAEKLGLADDMERILRELIARKPDYHHAYNALGYALADRNTRLLEAKALIERALALAPGDPFITDSLGWVEFRLGNLVEAVHLLKDAFEKRADIEIAVHLGEALWALGNKAAAESVFRKALDIQSDNASLKETLTRLGLKP